MLARTLDGVLAQARAATFELEIVVVDNDAEKSGRETVAEFQERGICPVIYDCEPEQNIALARNRTINDASGDFIAFIDDDEFPAENWLSEMLGCLEAHDADGVLGPVIPHFPIGTPDWLMRSGLCDRPRSQTGSPARICDLRTGNALLRRSMFDGEQDWFDRELGRSGGSDGQFLARQTEKGRKVIWCDQALVYETVPPDRWSRSYYLNRNLRIGILQGDLYRRSRAVKNILFCGISLVWQVLILPISAIGGESRWMRILTKIYYQGGCLFASLNLVRAPNR